MAWSGKDGQERSDLMSEPLIQVRAKEVNRSWGMVDSLMGFWPGLLERATWRNASRGLQASTWGARGIGISNKEGVGKLD